MIAQPKYKAGDQVQLEPRRYFVNASSGNYTIVQQLPPIDDDHQYRIKSNAENYHRVAPERLLVATTR